VPHQLLEVPRGVEAQLALVDHYLLAVHVPQVGQVVARILREVRAVVAAVVPLDLALRQALLLGIHADDGI